MFNVGMKFGTFELLQNKIIEYEKNNFCNLKIRDSKKLTAIANKIKKIFNQNLIYYEIKFVCFFGALYKNRSKSERVGNTYKSDCPFYLIFRASNDGQNLELKKLNCFHNHECSKNLFESLPDQRKVDLLDKNIQELISLNANLKLLQSKIQKETGKNITLKSLHNVKTKMSQSLDIENIVKILTDTYYCDVNILKSEENEVCALFFCDEKMKKNFEFYPEIMFMDGTYKLLDSRYLTNIKILNYT